MMKHTAIFFLFSTTLISAAPASPFQLAQEAFMYTNEFRQQKRLPSFLWDKKIADIAAKHSKNMGDGIVPFGHAGFDERFHAMSFCQSGAENVFMCTMQKDQARSAVESWIKSKGHLKNLKGPYTHCGIGVYQNSLGVWYFTQIFARY